MATNNSKPAAELRIGESGRSGAHADLRTSAKRRRTGRLTGTGERRPGSPLATNIRRSHSDAAFLPQLHSDACASFRPYPYL